MRTMANKDVIISIKGKQSLENAEGEVVELVTEGLLAREGEGEYSLSYQESALTGMEGTRTTFRVKPDLVTLLREGSYNSQMVFQPGRRHLSLYETPYGALSVGVNTRRVSSSLGEHGGDIEIDYAIEIDHALAGHNLFHINVRERGGLTQ